MREIRSYGSVGGLGREAQVYPEDRDRRPVLSCQNGTPGDFDSDPDPDWDSPNLA